MSLSLLLFDQFSRLHYTEERERGRDGEREGERQREGGRERKRGRERGRDRAVFGYGEGLDQRIRTQGREGGAGERGQSDQALSVATRQRAFFTF